MGAERRKVWDRRLNRKPLIWVWNCQRINLIIIMMIVNNKNWAQLCKGFQGDIQKKACSKWKRPWAVRKLAEFSILNLQDFWHPKDLKGFEGFVRHLVDSGKYFR